VYRVNRPRISWNETILKSILEPKSLWEAVLRVENKKIRDLIENGLISESELEEAKAARDMWYTYAEQVSLMEQTNASHSTPTGTEVGGVKRLIITDLSRMKEGRICIVGIDREDNVIRPVIPYSGVKEDYILDETGKPIITPFAEIEFKFIRPLPKPPHTEDWELDMNYRPGLIGRLSEEELRGFMERISDRSVREIFGAVIHGGRYTNPGEGNRSLGAIKAVKVLGVNYSMKEDGTYKYRITFSDMGGDVYNLPVTDCAFRRYCDRMRVPLHSGDSKSHSVREIQKTHPRAYEPWTEEDDARLIAERRSGKTIEELMELFGRQRGGIRSRLGKLGLLS